jgi:hypothetical protein
MVQIKGQDDLIVQVLSTTKTDTFSTTSALADITGLSVTITPASTSSKILVMVQCHIVGTNAGVRLQLVRGATAICEGDAAGSRNQASMAGLYAPSSPTQYGAGANHFHFLDSPNTTSATTYKVQGGVQSGTAYVGQLSYDLDNINSTRVPSTITVMEIVT